MAGLDQPLLPWYWRSHPLAGRTGSAVFAALYQHEPIATLLESPADSGLPEARYSICAGSPRRVQGELQLWTATPGHILPLLQSLLQRPAVPDGGPAELPFTGGWLGWLGYDLAWELEVLPDYRPDRLPFPVAYWYEPDSFAVLDHAQQTLWLAATDPVHLDSLERTLQQLASVPTVAPCPTIVQPLQFGQTQQEYEERVAQVKQYIQAGDIFQANLSLRFWVEVQDLSPWQLYQALQQINPSPFASYWQTPWGAVVSCSPERLVQLSDRTAQTRPIAGTRPRGQTPKQDADLAQALRHNSKEQAEHIMLVDLARNDLGRVCTWGSIRVDEFLVIERYSHVMHLVSNVVGQLQPSATSVDLIQALFPGGTITGCPKVRCMEIIEALEPERRSLFYGACGYLDQRGNLDFNLLIRTLLVTTHNQPNHHRMTIWGQVGAGIVADSDPHQEWQESLQKAQAQLIALRQTMAE